MVGRGLALLEKRLDASFATPTVAALGPLSERDGLLPGRQLHGEARISIEHKRGAVEHKLILAAKLVQIDEGQMGFCHSCDGDVQPEIRLRQVERRAIRRNEQLGAALLEA